MSRYWSPEKARGWRQRLGMSQTEVAKIVGVRTSTVSEWETGRKEPGSGLFIALADAYGVPLDEFVAHTPEVVKTCNGDVQKTTHGVQPPSQTPVGNAKEA